ncbi:glycosyltransferase family 2 protein [Dyella soli]|uniref:Glycosyltransferase family 2 protein n=1 Tax=Dyella soli TaxID=522319 RepID=A0A4R0YQZ1_9GAMM|nr:glycosyltransferase family A protein [Dyella soli]TCI08990.1 glycosyltransferase family 2 protein [Dyella soli]
MKAGVSFSVIITNYNYRDYVGVAVESVLAQTRAAAQVIVMDDGSTDGSAAWLAEHYGDDPRVTLRCVSNGGQLSAFVKGMDGVTGDVVCFLDADDHWGKDYLARIGELYDARRDLDFVFTDVSLFGNEEGIIGYADRATDLGYTAISTWVTAYWYGAATSALSMRRPWAQRALDLPAAFLHSWRISADNCLVFGSSLLGARKYFLPTGQVHYRVHGANGWWHARHRENQFANLFRSRSLINHYASQMHMDVHTLDLAKAEFRSKPAPGMDEAWRYARIALRRGSAGWPKRVERAISILRHGLRQKRAAGAAP